VGVFRVGGVGTPVYIYDDNNAAGGHVAGQPHTFAEIAAAFPLEFAPMQSAAGATFSGTHFQYLCVVVCTIGHPTAGNANVTTLTDTSGADIFSPSGRLQWSSANAATVYTNLGTKIGTGERMSGKNGCTIHQSGAQIFRGTVNMYGCFVDSLASVIQFLNGTGSGMEFGACIFHTSSGYVIGNSTSVNLGFYNSSLLYSGAGSAATSIAMNEAVNTVLGATAPVSFFQSASANRAINGLVFSGASTVADVRPTGTNPNWEMTNVTWSDTPGIPRVAGSLAGWASLPEDGVHEYFFYDTKVVDQNGDPVAGIPVFISNDVELPGVVNTQTLADGNIVFTWNPTGHDNVLIARDHYATGTDTLTRDRLYTVTVNGYGGAFPPSQLHQTVTFTFEWPGRDRFGASYVTDGGSFKKVMDVIPLPWGFPSQATTWVERVAP